MMDQLRSPTPTPLDVDNGRACSCQLVGPGSGEPFQGMTREWMEPKKSPDLNHMDVSNK